MNPTALERFLNRAILIFEPIRRNLLFGLNPLRGALTLSVWTIHNEGSNQAISF